MTKFIEYTQSYYLRFIWSNSKRIERIALKHDNKHANPINRDAQEPVSAHQADLRAAIKMKIFQEPQPPDEEVVEELRAHLCVESLYTIELLEEPTTLFKIQRDVLVPKVLSYQQEP